jgi:hypothetical protein
MPNDKAGAIRNLMLLTKKTISIFKNPDKIELFDTITQQTMECCCYKC